MQKIFAFPGLTLLLLISHNIVFAESEKINPREEKCKEISELLQYWRDKLEDPKYINKQANKIREQYLQIKYTNENIDKAIDELTESFKTEPSIMEEELGYYCLRSYFNRSTWEEGLRDSKGLISKEKLLRLLPAESSEESRAELIKEMNNVEKSQANNKFCQDMRDNAEKTVKEKINNKIFELIHLQKICNQMQK